MAVNPIEAKHELQQAEAAVASAERHLKRATSALGEPLRDAVQDAQVEAQYLLRRIDRFLAHLRTA